VGEAHDDAAFDLVEVEGVGGMAHAEEDEVAGVDGVGDLFLAEESEVFGDVAGAGGDGDVADYLRGEAAAETFGFGSDADGEGLVDERADGEFGVEGREGQVVYGGGFGGDAVVVHGVDAVGGDVHLVEVAVGFSIRGAEGVDAFYGYAAEGEIFGEFVIIDRDVGDVGAKPSGENIHKLASQQVSELAALVQRVGSLAACLRSLGFRVLRRPLIILATSLQCSIRSFTAMGDMKFRS